MGKVEAAVLHYSQALALNPNYAEAHANLANALMRQGNVDGAVASFRQAVTLKPDYAEAHKNLGMAFQAKGRLEEAVTHYRRALALKPFDIPVLAGLSTVLRESGRPLEALNDLFAGVVAYPESAELRRVLAETLRGVRLDIAGEQARATLAGLCDDDTISAQEISVPVLSLIKNTPGFRAVLSSVQSGSDPFASASPEVRAFTQDPLVLAAMRRMVICDADLEQVLTHLRRHILFRTKTKGGRAVADDAMDFDFACALARQCFNAEYAFFAVEDEVLRVDKLCAGLQKTLPDRVAPSKSLEWSLVLLALYGSLHRLKNSDRLLEPARSNWSESLQPLLREQVADYQRERELEAGFAALTRIKDGVSKAVRLQYEENPYPRWVSAHHPGPMSVGELFRRLRPGESVPDFPSPVSILVAGCGTGHNPIQYAVTIKDCEVLAVDLSRASLAYASRMTERLGITNITYQQADILELETLDRRFAIICCSGVLHHLKDPLAGWQVLIGLLQPGGLMKIGLYSEKARRNFQATSEYVRAQGFPPTPEGIRRCRRAILELPDGHPARSAITAMDFYSLSGFRDLFMHVQEQRFTIPGIAECLDKLGLRFLGFEYDARNLGRFRAMFPHGNALTDLTLWDRFEEAYPDSFRTMYQFWCCRK
nr:tetratricopeptide repeat protein [Nitrospirota bacterium]